MCSNGPGPPSCSANTQLTPQLSSISASGGNMLGDIRRRDHHLRSWNAVVGHESTPERIRNASGAWQPKPCSKSHAVSLVLYVKSVSWPHSHGGSWWLMHMTNHSWGAWDIVWCLGHCWWPAPPLDNEPLKTQMQEVTRTTISWNLLQVKIPVWGTFPSSLDYLDLLYSVLSIFLVLAFPQCFSHGVLTRAGG